MSDESPVVANRAQRRAAQRRGRKLAALGSGAVLASGAAGMAVTLTATPTFAAATFTVDDLSDTGPTAADCTDITVGNCSLRDAIDAANADAIEDVITFGVSGAITLTSDLEAITEAVDIQGPGASALTVDGVDDYQIFLFDDVDTGTPSISGLTLTNGDDNRRISDYSGGAIALYYSDAAFAFSNLVVSSSYAYNDGGGLVCVSGDADAVITNSTFSDNVADAGGGALYFDCDELTVTGSTFTNNEAGSSAGGLYLSGDTHTITNTTVSNNDAAGGGAGIRLGAGTLHLSDSTIADNDTEDYGGGLYLAGEEVTIERSTISSNTAENDGGGVEIYSSDDVTILASTISGNSAGGLGGGLYLYSDSLLTVANSTIAGNTADGSGGGIAVGNGELALVQTTISGNTAVRGSGDGLYLAGYVEPPPLRADSHAERQAELDAKVARGEAEPGDAPEPGQVTAAEADAVTITGTIVSGNIGGEDIEGDADAPGAVTANDSLLGGVGTGITLSGAGNQTGVNTPGLGALANNGGPTQTMKLLAGSPAIDTGPAAVPAFLGNGTDQRGAGFVRVVNGRVDIGAYELELEGLFTG